MNETVSQRFGTAAPPVATPYLRYSLGEKRGVLLLIVLSMLTLFMMLGAAYLVVATRSRETARAYARLSLRSDNVRLPHSQIFDTVMLRVLRGVPADQPSNVSLAQPAQNAIGTTVKAATTTYSALGRTYQFESILSDKYGFETLSGTAKPTGPNEAVYEAAPLLVLPHVVLDPAQLANFPGGLHGYDLAGRVLTLLGPGRDPSSHRILHAKENNGSYELSIDNQPRNRSFDPIPAGDNCRVVINGREFSGNGTSSPHEAWDGFDDLNPFLAAVLPRDKRNILVDTINPLLPESVASSIVRKVGFVQNGSDDLVLKLLTSGTNGFDYAADNDNDGVKDGFYLDFGLPTVIATNGDQITLHASVLVVDLDGRVNVNAHGSLVPIVYPFTQTATSSYWLMQNLPTGFPNGKSLTIPTGSGYGPPEVNLDLLFPSAASTEATYSFDRLQSGEMPLRYLRTGVSGSRLAGVSGGQSPWTARYYASSGATTPQVYGSEGRYGNRLPSQWATSGTTPWLLGDVSGSKYFTQPGVMRVNDAASAINDHRSTVIQSKVAKGAPETLRYEGIPPAWWNADAGATFNWADNTNFTATGTNGLLWNLPVPRATYNSPPDLHGRMKTYTVPASTGVNPGMVPQLCFVKPEWSGAVPGMDVETRDDPYEIRLDTRAPRNSWLFNYSADNNPRGNIFNLSELENILRPYDIDSQKLPPRLEAILGSVAEEARLRITTDSWDTTAITGTAANAVSNWVKTKLDKTVRNDPEALYGSWAKPEPGLGDTAQLSGLLTRELARMERFDLNRPLAGLKPSTYDINNRYYAQRQAYFQDLYILLCALTNGGQGGFDAQRCAQWAANVVEFRDADSTMTPFEYDTNPEDGWEVDGNAKTVDTDANYPEPAVAKNQRQLVFGTERPEMVITETSAWEATDIDTGATTGELFIVLHRPWNAKAFARLKSGTDTSVSAEACDPLLDSYDPSKNPLDQVDLGRKSGTPPQPPNNNTDVIGANNTLSKKYPIWRLRIDAGGDDVSYVRCDVKSGGANELVLTGTTSPRIAADGWICLQGTNNLAGQQITYSQKDVEGPDKALGQDDPTTFNRWTFDNFRVPGKTAFGNGNRTATIYLERLTDPTADPTSDDWNLPPTTKPGNLSEPSLDRMAIYRVVDQATVEVVNRTPEPISKVVPPEKVAMKSQRATTDPKTAFWNNTGFLKPPLIPLSTQVGPFTPTEKPVWFNWPNRPFIGSPELYLVHSLDSESLLKNYTKPTLDPLATPDNWTAALLTTLKNPPLFDALAVPTRFAGIHNSTTDPKGNLASFARLDQVTTPVNQLTTFREPGRVNLNTITADDVWNAVVAGPLVKNDGFPEAVKNRADANFATTPAQNSAGLLSLNGGEPTANVKKPIADTNAIFTSGSPKPIDLNPAHGIYTATRLANTATTRSHLFGVWITLREATAPPGVNPPTPADPDAIRYHRAFYVIDRSIPVAHEPGRDHNVWDAVLLRRIVE